MKAYRGSRGIAPPILNLETTRRGVVKFVLSWFSPRATTPVPSEEAAQWAP